MLRSQPDVVALRDDREVARRWLMLCPKRRDAENRPEEPNDFHLNMITNDRMKLKANRSRLSDISWWMRFLSQKIAQRANREDDLRQPWGHAHFEKVAASLIPQTRLKGSLRVPQSHRVVRDAITIRTSSPTGSVAAGSKGA